MTIFAGTTDQGVTVVRRYDDGRPTTVDYPGAGRYRQPYDGGVTGLEPVVPIGADLTDHCGWYGQDGALLTQVPEPDLGEPMVLLARGDRVVRLYPTARGLLGEDATVVRLGPDTLHVDGVPLPRTPAYSERDVAFTAAGTSLAGTLVTPAGPGPHPAAVLVHGAGGGQRDFGRLFARPVLDAGVAVLLYDKAGHGSSGGSDPSIFDQADAVDAAIDQLHNMSDVDSVGLVAFSNGGWSAPMVAARRTDVAFIMGIGVPGISMAGAEVHRRTKLLREAGMSEASVAAVGRAWSAIFAVAAAGGATPEASATLDAALREVAAADDLRGYAVPDHVRHNPMLSPIPPAAPTAELVAMLAGEPHPELSHDPVADYARTTCPIILHYGAEDTSVPAALSVDAIRSVRPDVDAHVYPDLEHMLNVVPANLTGLTAETAMYGFHRFAFGPDVQPTITARLRTLISPQ